MGRKKKVVQAVEEPAKQDANKTATKSSGGIGYSGIITVKINKGNKTISSKQYKNTGTFRLFQFIANCLGGNYYYNDRPCRIRLFTSYEGEDPTDPEFDYPLAGDLIASALVYYDTTPKVVRAKDENNELIDKYLVTFQFRIPYALITTDRPVCKMALYDGKDSLYYDYLAKFALTKRNETTQEISFDYITFEDADFKQNYSLIVEWTMEISNQNTITTTQQSTNEQNSNIEITPEIEPGE